MHASAQVFRDPARRPDPGPARIGPNALIQTRAAVTALYGPSAWERVRRASRLPSSLPGDMVDERYFRRLVEALIELLGMPAAHRILGAAGARTADYVRCNRIPAVARGALRLLPDRWSRPLLLRAIQRHAWTFVGSGRMEHRRDRIVIDGCLTCTGFTSEHPTGAFYQAAFESLLSQLSDPRLRVEETHCVARGDDRCVFRIRRGADHRSLPSPPTD